MSCGYWGSRFPIGNLASSSVIGAMMRARLTWLRLRNCLRGTTSGKHVQVTNGLQQEQQFHAWLAKGYDKINVGGGPKNLRGFVNIDFLPHPTVEREVVANILDLSFLPSQVLSHVHSNHVIEHLTESDIKAQLKQYHRILRSEGLVTIRCPNALGVTYGFWFAPVIEGNHEHFIEAGYPPDEDYGNPLDGWFHRDFFGFVHWMFGDFGNPENQHLSIITPTKLSQWLLDSGFELLAISEPESANLVVVARKASERKLLHG